MQLSINWHLFLTIMAQCDKIIRHLQYEVEIYRVLKKSTFKNFKSFGLYLIRFLSISVIGLSLSFNI